MGQSNSGPTERVRFPDRPVNTDGRVQIPYKQAEGHGIEQGELYDVYVYTEDGGEVYMPDSTMGTQYRVAIPTHRMEKYGIEPGDEVDVFVEIPVEG